MSIKNDQKKIEMHVLPDGTRKYVVVIDTEKSPSEKKQSERRTRNADSMARALFGN
ncbi:hypothetical protein ACE3KB_16980 [Enterobacter hormaechei subsp. oharae]|nr:hypothetical protein [Escherichia coli]MCM7221392.1 hypothetical protein [Enterobacter hormaechei]